MELYHIPSKHNIDKYSIVVNKKGTFDLSVFGWDDKSEYIEFNYVATFDTYQDALTAITLIEKCMEKFDGMA